MKLILTTIITLLFSFNLFSQIKVDLKNNNDNYITVELDERLFNDFKFNQVEDIYKIVIDENKDINTYERFTILHPKALDNNPRAIVRFYRNSKLNIYIYEIELINNDFKLKSIIKR